MVVAAPDLGSADLRAGGTIAQPAQIAWPQARRRIRLLIEIGLFFMVAPILITFAVYGLRVPLFLALQPVLAGFILYLLWDDTFHLKRELAVGVSLRTLLSILVIFVLAGLLITAFVAQQMPRAFLAFPRLRPGLWAMVLVLYPVMSVLAQELVFRTFFFHRYGPLFGQQRTLAIGVNGALFGFAHVMFYNPVAMIATTVLGWLLAWRYTHTRSYWAVFVEHTLYGWLIFTIGLGAYFFTGIANPRW